MVGPLAKHKKDDEHSGAMTWCWVHVKPEFRKPKVGSAFEVERWVGRGAITVVEFPGRIRLDYEIRGFPDPDLFWQLVTEWESEMDQLGFTKIETAANFSPLEHTRFVIDDFKSLVERQLYKDISVGGKPQENIARALLQAFLKPRSYREVPVRGGQSDLLLFSKNGRFLFETKIWRGAQYYEQGIRELEEYIAGEDDCDEDRLAGIFYLVFDNTKSNRARKYLGSDGVTQIASGRSVEIVVVNLSLPQPSKKDEKAS
jgi:hypothetical protein